MRKILYFNISFILCIVFAGFTGSSVKAQSANLDFQVLDRVGWKAGRSVPSSVTETYSYNESTDTVTVKVTFNTSGYAALPPMLALAKKYGYPVNFDKTVETTTSSSVLGPLMGVPNTNTYTYTVKGLGKYVLPKRVYGSGSVPSDLQQELQTEVQKIIDAGHLTPWILYTEAPRSSTSELRNGTGYPFWFFAGEQLYYLSEVLPLLPTTQQTALKNYLKSERSAYPPETKRSMSFTDGTRRQIFPQTASNLTAIEQIYMAYLFTGDGKPIIWQLYPLARHYEATGEVPSAAVMNSVKTIVTDDLTGRDWGTLYWQKGKTPEFNAVHGANRMFAGFVGYIRLARMAGDKNAEALGWGMLTRMAILRFSMSKYNRFEYDTGRFTIPSDPAWFAKEKCNGPTHGELITFNWTKPEDNVRQVHLLDDYGVETWEWKAYVDWNKPEDIAPNDGQKIHNVTLKCIYGGDPSKNISYFYSRRGSYQLAFADITPELGRFLKDYLKSESQAFIERVSFNTPHWYVAYMEGFLDSEDNNVSAPYDSYHHFMARAWVTGETPSSLAKYADKAWLPKGDFFYINKLAEAIKAYKGWSWSDGSIPTSPPLTGAGKPGDANNDNKVDGLDYVVWLNHYNQNATGAANGDFNNSGKVDGLDYVIWLNNYNQ